VKSLFLLLFIASSVSALGQSAGPASAAASQPTQSEPASRLTLPKLHADELTQELDADAVALSRIPADPLVQPDPLAPFLRPVDRLANKAAESLPLKFGATYTFLNQYATSTPRGRTSSAAASTSPAPGASTATAAPVGPSACSFAPEPTSG